MDNSLIVDIRRFEVVNPDKLVELESLLERKNINSKDLMLILDTLKFNREKPPTYSGKKLPNKISFVRGRARIRIADRLISLKVRKG